MIEPKRTAKFGQKFNKTISHCIEFTLKMRFEYALCESGQNENVGLNGYSSENYSSKQRYETKIPLKLVMDPRGVVQDVHSTGTIYEQNNGMLSPDKCAELISALHTDAPKGKGWFFTDGTC